MILDKHSPDAFEETDLQSALSARGVETLIIAGMQTEMCVHASVERGAALGYRIVLVEDRHTTFDFEDEPAEAAIQAANAELAGLAEITQASAISFV